MARQVKNATFSLPVELLEKFREYAQQNYISSVNAGVREAMEEYILRIEKEKLHLDMLEAAKDPLFMKDLEDNMEAFAGTDRETAKGVPEW